MWVDTLMWVTRLVCWWRGHPVYYDVGLSYLGCLCGKYQGRRAYIQ